jgi:hypothetical protein
VQISFLQLSPVGEANARVTAKGQAKATTPKIRSMRRKTPKSVVLIAAPGARSGGSLGRPAQRPEDSACRIATVAAFPRLFDGREKASVVQVAPASSSSCRGARPLFVIRRPVHEEKFAAGAVDNGPIGHLMGALS